MLDRRQNRDIPILNEYNRLLKDEWTRPAACQNECGSDESCDCLRHIVHVDAQKAWWTRQASESGKQTQLQRLLDEMPPAEHRTFPLNFQKLFVGEYSCLRVFSLLLKQGKEHLIDSFYESDMNDKYLAIVRRGGDQSLLDNLVSITPRKEAEQIIKDFHEEKWAYCPLELTLHMDRNLQGTKVIPPFCRKWKLGNKGGTASIYFVAIQRDLVSHEPLKRALHDSLYNDPDYGKCYKMALKSYCGNKRSAYDLEKEAFSALKSTDEVPIVRYLGCYTHDYGEGSDMGKTYNLLLEFGETDLYESWADETNVPPVRAMEIVRYWDSLFDVARAIRHVHHLEVQHGKNAPLRYHGYVITEQIFRGGIKKSSWHADIKPDNILLVQGQLKLADFGFSRFAPVAERENGCIPTEFIYGFTDTYGAPEVSRMKRTDGTLSGVTQSIDTWSFGCVLSVAATWIVLGFQGVRQYEKLRRISPGNSKHKIKYDRFHDGSEVLPEVRKWHEYLRGHLRPSDTLTSSVLDVVELKMLQTQPSARFDLEELCKNLKELTELAPYKIDRLQKSSQEADATVLTALLMFEEAAENLTSLYQELNPDPIEQPSVENGIERVNPRQRTSVQIQRENAIKSKPLGQTAFRRDIIKKELKSHGINWEDTERSDGGRHDGAITDSPIGTQSSMDLFPVERKTKPRNPQIQGFSRLLSADVAKTPNPRKVGFETTSTYFSDRESNGHPQTPRELPQGQSNGSVNPYLTPIDAPESMRSNRRSVGEPETPLGRQSTNPPWPGSPPRSSPRSAEDFNSPFDSPSPVTYAVGSPIMLNSPPPFTPIDGPVIVPSSGWPPVQTPQPNFNTAPKLSHPTPNRRNTSEGHASDFGDGASNHIMTSPKPGPSITLSPVQSSQFVGAFPDGLHSVAEENAVRNQPDDDPRSKYFGPPVPSSVYELPFNICQKRKELDQEVPNRFGKLKGKLGFESRNKDNNLVHTFSEPRELILVMDNGWTMFPHWPIAIFVAETLAKNAAGLDRNGFDVRFTIEGNTHDKDNLKGDSGRSQLKNALNNAWPENNENEHSKTDMGAMFTNLFNEWKRKGQRATTLLVLTDGVWSKTNEAKLNQTILDIARLDNRHTGNRHFSIQFVRFGDTPYETGKLQWLDDELCKFQNFRDIIDHCSWRTDVDKIFKGSIEGYQDQINSTEPANPYHYPDLVTLFSRFNQVGSARLKPPSQDIQHTPSRSSSRGSNRHSRSSSIRYSVPLGRTDNWQVHSQTSPQPPFSA